MGSHIAYDRLMKTTIEIADDLFERVQRLAREQKTTFRALTETGLRMVLSGRQRRRLQKASLQTADGSVRQAAPPSAEGVSPRHLRERRPQRGVQGLELGA